MKTYISQIKRGVVEWTLEFPSTLYVIAILLLVLYIFKQKWLKVIIDYRTLNGEVLSSS